MLANKGASDTFVWLIQTCILDVRKNEMTEITCRHIRSDNGTLNACRCVIHMIVTNLSLFAWDFENVIYLITHNDKY